MKKKNERRLDEQDVDGTIRNAMENGKIPLQDLSSIQRRIANIEQLTEFERIRHRLRVAHRDVGFRPVAASLYVEDLAKKAEVPNEDVIKALGFARERNLEKLDIPSADSLSKAASIGINDRIWKVHLKLAALRRHDRTLPIIALRNTASATAASSDDLIQMVETQLVEEMQTGLDNMRAELAACDAVFQRFRSERFL